MPLKSEKEIAELEEAYESVVHQIPEDLEGDSDLISNTGPEAAEGFESSVPEYEKEKDEDTEENKEKPEKLVKDSINTFNNNHNMNKENNIFDKLYQQLMESDDLPPMDEDPFSDEAGEELGGDEFGGEGDSDTITVDLPRDVAEKLHEVLGSLLDVDPESEIEDLDDLSDDEEDPFGNDSPFEDSIEIQADPKELPDSNLKTGNNSNKQNKLKASGYHGRGGKAQSGKVPEPQADPKELADSNLKSGNNSNKNNKVSASGYASGDLIK